MSPTEVAWRIGNEARDQLSRITPATTDSETRLRADCPDWDAALEAFRAADRRPVLLDRARAEHVAAKHPALVASVIAAADRVGNGRFDFFGYGPVQLPVPIDWNSDPISGVQWPALPAARIDHRTAQGDPKWIWELNRLQHLPWLAQAWLFTGDDTYAAAAFEQLDSWLEQNPPGHGIAWRGAFEAGIRAISVAIALQGFRDSAELTPKRYRAIVTMLVESARRCWTQRSRFSSANNHLIGELAGAATVGLLFPELADAARWGRAAVDVLRAEADRQILPDGAGAEQAVGYQMFTVELIGVVAALLAQRDGTAPQELTAAVRRSTDYLAALVGENDPAPRYGDDDEGFALRLGAEPIRTVRDHLGIAAALLGSALPAPVSHRTISALWLHADAETSHEEHIPARNLHAPNGGLVVLRDEGRRIAMDVGPLGYLSIAAHGHADALSLVLAIDGQDVIGDPGAASYYGHPEWRQVHRGTRAHATMSVDGQDQSVIAGPFMWTNHADVHVRAVDLDAGIVDAEHFGYRRLPGRPVHRRWLIAPPNESTVVVVDLLTGTGDHDAVVSWPLHPTLDVLECASGFHVTRGGVPVLGLSAAATAPLRFDAIRGDTETHLGWWSERLESREPAWLLGAHTTAAGPVAIVTVLDTHPSEPESITDTRVALADGVIEAYWTERGVVRSLRLDLGRDGTAIAISQWR
ncbi:alginate lyase family protein [Aldersonia kunmingensis]|uniref:alginate lyase family protein n=1 Tax=Aldersonia kunmingensis TaxID=408066 RepID=UPI0009FCEAB4|nr:alginate lyase family protein [Aldersonia kunmingensis]